MTQALDTRAQDLTGISEMLASFAAALPANIRAAERESPMHAGKFETVNKYLRQKFHCSALRPHELSKEVMEALPGYKALADACGAKHLDAAFHLAVCHFKPGPDADGRYKIQNPEALVIVSANPEEAFERSQFSFYADVYAGTMNVTLGLADTGKVELSKPLKLTAAAPQKPQLRIRLK